MRSDSVISRTLEAGRRADVMVFGVGAVSTSTTLFEGSYLDTRMLDELISLGAVGRSADASSTPTVRPWTPNCSSARSQFRSRTSAAVRRRS